MKNKLTSTYTICFGAMLSCLLWGSAAPCIKIGYSLFEISGTASQLLFAGIRFIIAGILTILFGSILSRKILIPQKSSIPDVFKLAMVQTVLQYIFFYIGLANTSGVNASIINASNVFVSLLFSCLIFKFEKLTTRKIFGSVIGFFGVILINVSGAAISGNFSFAGEGAIFMSCLSYGLSSCLIKRYSQRENPVTLSGYQFFIGGIVLTIVGLLFGGRITHISVQAVMLLIYLALVSSIAYTLWGILLKYNPVGKVAVFGFMNPIFGVILSAWLLGEQNQAFSIIGVVSLLLTCIGIYIVNSNSRNKNLS